MSGIVYVHAREILDSRGYPTIEVDVHLSSGAMGRASVPSGASRGEREAVELRDQVAKRYGGKGVTQAVRNVNKEIGPRLVGLPAEEQAAIDRTMIKLDGTRAKSRLGANAILGVSLAVAKAAAQEAGQSLYRYLGGVRAVRLPLPLMNLINGGAHADTPLTIQEFLILPVGALSFSEALRIGSEVFHSLKELLKERGHRTSVGDEGGMAPDLSSTEEAVSLLIEGSERAGYTLGKQVSLALDAAASSLYREGRYTIDGQQMTSDQLIEYWEQLTGKYPIISLEDPLSERDWRGWRRLTERIGDRVQLVGDDIFVTNVRLLRKGIDSGVANAILIKVNQIGTLTETLETVETAQRAGYASVISHRSGETEDITIADLAVATGSGRIKAGAPSRTDRVAKYNQLLRIEEELGAAALFG